MNWLALHISAFFFALSAFLGFGGGVAWMPPPTTQTVACTTEAKECPDGSYVGRTGPDCAFALCPTTPAPAPKPTPAPTPTPVPSKVSIVSIQPASGGVGTTVTIGGSGFTSDNTVHFGTGVIEDVASSPAVFNCPMIPAGSSNTGCGGYSELITFTVPSSLNPACYYSNPRCLIASQETQPGSYQITVSNANGTSNAATFTVTDPSVSQGVTLRAITPNSGPVGTTVTLTGFGFTSDNVVHFGGGAIANVPIASSIAVACTTDPSCIPGIRQTLTFTVPFSVGPYCPSGTMCPMYMQEITPGTYTVYVQNGNGSSNSVSFTVTGAGSVQTLSVNGLDAPTTLALGQVGTWTVHATATSGTQLHYSVVWGDEAAQGSAIMAPAPSNIQTSATFTHAYEHSGVYTPTFTVTDDTGASASVGGSITVTPLY